MQRQRHQLESVSARPMAVRVVPGASLLRRVVPMTMTMRMTMWHRCHCFS